MAQGDVVYFDEFVAALMKGEHNLESDEIRAIMIDNTTVATAADAEALYDSYGEVTGTLNEQYGVKLANKTVTQTGGTGIFTASAFTFRQGADEPTDFFQVIIYNESHPDRAAICFIDATVDGGVTPIDLTGTDWTWTPNADGIVNIARG